MICEGDFLTGESLSWKRDQNGLGGTAPAASEESKYIPRNEPSCDPTQYFPEPRIERVNGRDLSKCGTTSGEAEQKPAVSIQRAETAVGGVDKIAERSAFPGSVQGKPGS